MRCASQTCLSVFLSSMSFTYMCVAHISLKTLEFSQGVSHRSNNMHGATLARHVIPQAIRSMQQQPTEAEIMLVSMLTSTSSLFVSTYFCAMQTAAHA